MEFLATVASWLTPTTLFLLLNIMIGTIVITSRFGSGHKKPHPLVEPFGSGRTHHHHHSPLARAPSLIDRVKSINFHLYKFPSPETDLFTTHLDATGSDPIPHPDPHPDPHPHPAPLARAPSLLDRVKSINLSHFKFPQYHPENNDYAPTTRPDYDSPEPSQIKIQEHDEQRDRPGPGFGDPVDPPRLARAPSLLERVKSINFSSFYKSDPTHMDQDPDPPKEDHKPRRSKSETKKPAKKATKMTKSASERHVETAEAVEEVERRRPETARVERSTSFGDGEDGVDAKAADFINKFKHQLKLQRLDSILRYKEMLKSN